MDRRPVTLEEVARVAGVSRATVSRVVNGVATVDRELRQVVERAISTTGYTPNRAARSLVTRRAGAVGLVLPDEGRTLHDPYFGRVVSGVMPVIRPLGVQLVLTTTDPGGHQEVVDDVRQRRLDGVILIHTHGADPLPRLLTEANLPVVLAARPVRPMAITYVDVDQAAGAALAVDHLVDRGCRRPATITGPLDAPAGQDRLRGFREAVARHGLPEPLVVEGDFSREGGAAAARRLAGEVFDGLFVASDLMATGALPVLRDRGLRVPEDVKVVGFDDSSPAVECDPPLTTVRQPVEDMAAEMARLLVERVERPDRPNASVVFAPTLVVRRSS
ncbi:LacI family DNA-binding transcriptional regulator [Saccharothrix yanglingensis]|uniref:LacI family transcriptional regulator n=1 Tax=Saccharothrix yanglingensis TaxID=659496 RepID=A0ABU0X6D7_9PSEU|nr:LacI family DNA-binding transcriptional regulator [Saccharothrix yanglingensis]MDQ2587675.1 LacI family transcriptional regulator [Saccharothrix yanglingensis]